MGKKGSTWNKLQQKVFLQDSDQNFLVNNISKVLRNPSRGKPLKTELKINY